MNHKTNKNLFKAGALTLAVGAGFSTVANAQPAPQVYLNGTPLRLDTAPIQQSGRVLVPMRDIFEALGATVSYNSLSQAIAAQKGSTTVRMALGSANATVNNLPIKLDAPAQSYYGKTMVPLRFVSEAMGADVSYNAGTRIVSIAAAGAANPGGTTSGGTQVAGIREISIPAQTVVPVTLDQEVSSATAYKGQNVTATVVSEKLGDSEFPSGTKLEGVVTEATKKSGANPGVLDLNFSTAILPDGSRVNISGNPVALDETNVTNQDGHIVAKGEARKNNTLKVVGIGAGVGFVVGKLLKKDGALPAIIGGLGGFLLDHKNSKNNQVADAKLDNGTKLGVRLRTGVTYRDTTGYYDARSNYVKL